LARPTDEEKRSQLARREAFHGRNAVQAQAMLRRLRDTAIADGNVLEALMDEVRVRSLGQVTNALFEVGGQYRRNT
jgi:methylmalonyl-CoA mutase